MFKDQKPPLEMRQFFGWDENLTGANRSIGSAWISWIRRVAWTKPNPGMETVRSER
jgi:hypothetical protein